jgi:L-lactate utilization protein LutC
MGETVIEKVRRALGRSQTPTTPPVPPVIDEPITRLVHSDLGLPELFAKRAAEQKMHVDLVSVDELNAQLIDFLKTRNIKRIALPISPLLQKLGIVESIRAAGFEAHTWDTMTLDEMYDFDCAVTDVTYAVAECGLLAILPDPAHGRSITLTPMYHIAILEPKNFLPDLVDLFDKLAADHRGKDAVLISGPSKTADIEMNVVTGVHGPNYVQAFILQ